MEPPFLCLVVSGGHTHLVEVGAYDSFTILGRTRDDAAGEAFDKVARVLGLGYPGGPKIDKIAKEGDKDAIAFPRAKAGDAEYDFSFSGVKSGGCCGCVSSTCRPCSKKSKGKDQIVIAGGVASNSALREKMRMKRRFGFECSAKFETG